MTLARKNSPLVVAFALSGVFFLTLQGWMSVRNGLSDLYARPAINYLEEKVATDATISESQWQAVYDSVSGADDLMPANPRYLQHLGWLQQVKLSLLADALDIEQLARHSLAAEEYYLDALAARPTWPYYWGSVALEKHRRGDFDTGDFSEALINAVRFGPWNEDVQLLVADLGSDTLQFLSPGAQRAYAVNLERGLSRQSEAMLETVDDWEYVCDVIQLPDPFFPLLSSQCERIADAVMP